MSLSVSRIVNVTVNLSPLAAQERDFGASLIIGSSGIIPMTERIRLYNDIESVAADFGTSAPEYAAAALHFNQTPQPSELYIGQWAKTATAGALIGAPLTVAEQAIANFQAITSGAVNLNIDGVAANITAVNLSGAANLNAVAALLTTAWTTKGTVTWNPTTASFTLKSNTTGTSSTVTVASDTPLGALLNFRASDGPTVVPGFAAETPLVALTALADKSGAWYSANFADASLTPSQHVANAGFIEASGISRMYGVTSQDAQELVPGQTTSVGYQLAQLGYERTYWQYSSTNPYAAVSMFARASTVNFDGSNTTITLKFKNEPGIVPENLSATQANAIEANNGNVFVAYNNDTSILEQGTMASGAYFDEIHGLAWLQNAIQTAVYNVLVSNPKVPQTDAGVNQLVTAVNAQCAQGVTNGLIAPGVWTLTGFGGLNQGDTLSSGYYTYAPPIATQSQADREARKAPPIQCAVKLAGAIHSVTINVNVNR